MNDVFFWWGGIVFLVCSLLCFIVLFRARRVVREAVASLREGYPFLDDSRAAWIRWFQLDALFEIVGRTRDEKISQEKKTASQLLQLQTTFRSMRESVLILDHTTRIVSSNEAAANLLNRGFSLKGLPVTNVFRSPALLEMIRGVQRGETQTKGEIETQRLGRRLWFDASVIPLENVGLPETDHLVLIVLHDITRLKQLEAIRRDFVANVSHELRTPITIIKGFAETLDEDFKSLPPEQQQVFVEKIRRNSERLHELVEDLLSLSRLESNPDVLKLEEVIPDSFIESWLGQFEPPADSRPISLRFVPGATGANLQADVTYLRQLLQNLVENAFRHGEINSFVEVATTIEEDALCISVVDDGIGVPEKDIERVFQRFYRVEAGRSRTKGGTGLGLSIVKHIALCHGGEVYAMRREPRGSRFVCKLPLTFKTAAT